MKLPPYFGSRKVNYLDDFPSLSDDVKSETLKQLQLNLLSMKAVEDAQIRVRKNATTGLRISSASMSLQGNAIVDPRTPSKALIL